MTKPVGILGGTFDPVHIGHLRLAMEIYQQLALTEVRLIPLNTPPHRHGPVASAEHRLRMLELAIAGSEGLVIDDRELRRKGKSYTIDTVTSIRAELGNQPLFLIMGMDAFQALHSWHKWTLLLDYVHIIIAGRPGSDMDLSRREVAEFYKNNSVEDYHIILQAPAGNIYKTSVPKLEISATRIRALISAKNDVRFLLPDNVLSYIQQESLYL